MDTRLTRPRFKLLEKAREARALQGLYSASEIREILHRERARSDRNGKEFCLVVFDLGEDSGGLRLLALTLARRARLTDLIGWFDTSRLAAVLPDTAVSGAWTFADEVCAALESKALSPQAIVWSYPSHWLRRLNGNPPGSHPGRTKVESAPGVAAGHNTLKGTAVRSGAVPTHFHQDRSDGMDVGLARPLSAWKRAVDISVAVLGLTLLSPLMLLVAAYIKVVSPGPVFFKQQRVGYRGKSFIMWKFRTMKVGADSSQHRKYLSDLIRIERPMTKMQDDDRLIPFAKFLRNVGVDELPQLINVLRGDMSLVGPRPCIPYEALEYQLWETERFDAMPGMTGLWQVSGKNQTTFKQMVRMDIAYSRQSSVWLDIRILLKTVPAIVAQIKSYLPKSELQENAGTA